MKRLALSLIFSALTLASTAPAEVIESQRMDEAISFLEADTLVIFDLDNTIIEPTTSLGGDQWFSRLVKANKKAGMSNQDAKDAAALRWVKVQPFVQVRPVEANTPKLIAELQASGYRVMGLTARPETARTETLRQLASVGVGFVDDVGLRDGILFVNNRNKGEALLKMAQEQGRKLTSVELIDDKQDNVNDMNEALSLWNEQNPDAYIKHLEVRYGAADARVAAYDHTIAETQERFLQGIVPDAEVSRFLRSQL